MRFRIDRLLPGVAIVALLMTAPVRATAVQPDAARRPTSADIERAIAIVKADPNLATERPIKMLRWTGSTLWKMRPGRRMILSVVLGERPASRLSPLEMNGWLEMTVGMPTASGAA